MFDRYYQGELTFLREMGASFAAAHPELAPMLGESDGDPDVERLLEGFAFLTGRLQQRIDGLLPELGQALCEWVAPQLLRPLPAATVVELTPTPGSLKGNVTVPAGSTLASRPVRGERCQFRTAWPITLAPAEIKQQIVRDGSAHAPSIEVKLELLPGGVSALQAADELPFFLHGDAPLTAQLLLWFGRHLESVVVHQGQRTVGHLGPDRVRLPGFDDERALWPWPAFAAKGFRLLSEYFTFPAKLRFVSLTGLSTLSLDSTNDDGEITFRFRFQRPPALPTRVPNGTFRLHCVPVVNLFKTDATPLRIDGLSRPQLLRPVKEDPLHAEVFAVRSVCTTSKLGQSSEIHPYHAFRSDEGMTGFSYSLHRKVSPIDEGLHTMLSLVPHRGRAEALTEQNLSIELECTNRSLVEKLGPGDVDYSTGDTPAGVDFKNITAVSQHVRHKLGEAVLWRLLGHLACLRRGLRDVHALRELLRVYNFQRNSDHPRAASNDNDIDAIQSLSTRAATRIITGAPCRGHTYHVELDAARFATEGSAFVFGTVVDSVLSSQTPLNAFHALSATLQPSGYSLDWSPRIR